ncbi:MAG: sigma-70 family RNA polymerase sigma factor [Acidimicrobiales bacterium]|nr:sigma-70 family RNA polymerase sigma factor [Acidimicrobiales bacterium]
MGERAAVTELVERNLPLVRQVVAQVAAHFPRHVDREELARAGTLGLVEAARRYDGERGVPFERFAAQRIRGAILDAVRQADWAPRAVRTVARRVDLTSQELASNLGRSPTRNELAGALGVSQQELSRVQERVYRAVVLALDHPTSSPGDDDDTSLGDVLADRTHLEPPEELEARELLGYLRDAVDLLPDRHRLVIAGYFLEGRTSLELAGFLGVTESRISQLRSEALELLREGIEAQYETAGRGDAAAAAPVSRARARRVAYAEAIATASTWRGRLEPATGH